MNLVDLVGWSALLAAVATVVGALFLVLFSSTAFLGWIAFLTLGSRPASA